MEDIEELYKVSDFVLLSLPLNNDTKNLINLSAFKLMKKNFSYKCFKRKNY